MSLDSPVINTLGSLYSVVFLSPENFLKSILMLVLNTPRSHLGVFITGESRILGVFTTTGESRILAVFITGKLRLPSVL
jgi:hypothetical protein